MTRIGVVGAAGFVGSAVTTAAQAAGHEVIAIHAPRIRTSARDLTSLAADARLQVQGCLGALEYLHGTGVIINAAGLASPGARCSDELVGANALWPAILVLSAPALGCSRLVHVSSAAVFGRASLLSETSEPRPDSPYGYSKLLGDKLAKELAGDAVEIIVYRPTSVQGSGRRTTQMMGRIANSPLSSVSGKGDQPTPQALVQNVAAATLFLAFVDRPPTHPVLHPWERLTTLGLLQGLAQGRPPVHVPPGVARIVINSMKQIGRHIPALDANIRRLELMWFGQAQDPGWLERVGFEPPVAWDESAFAALAANGVRRGHAIVCAPGLPISPTPEDNAE
jgi:UDP-glucose 4-epimerase